MLAIFGSSSSPSLPPAMNLCEHLSIFRLNSIYEKNGESYENLSIYTIKTLDEVMPVSEWEEKKGIRLSA